MSEVLDIINTIRTAEFSQREPLFVEGEKHFQSRMLIYLYELFNKPKNAWNLVSEGLPTKSEWYLFQRGLGINSKMELKYFTVDKNLWIEDWNQYSAWMPLPEPYCTG